MQLLNDDYTIAFLTYTNFLALESNPRLLSYYKHSLEHGQKPIFLFIKGFAQTPYASVQKDAQSLLGLLKQYNRLYRFIKRSKSLKVLYIYSPISLYRPLERLAKKSGIRVVKERTEVDSLKPVKTFKGQILKWLYKLDERTAAQEPHVVITPQIAKYLHLKNSVLIPAFIRTDLYHQPAQVVRDSNTFVIGYFGSFGPKDQVEELLRSVNLMSHHPVRVKLMGSLPNGLKHLKEETWNFETEWISNLHTKDVIQELSACDVAICHRDSSLYSAMGFPSKIMEYMLANVRILCADTGNIRTHMEPAEIIYYSSKENQGLLKAINGCLEDSNSVDHAASVKQHHFQQYAQTWYTYVFSSPF
jgi:glycosyltransferase involved in cell wall biosynthesis